jgi:lycopene cyclase domain-containing protein
MSVLYLVVLVLALACMVVLDRRFRLFFWRDGRRAGIVLTVGVLFFLAWDLTGIGLHVFARGLSAIATGIVVAPELPLEELFFLVFLCYLTMNLMAAGDALRRRVRTRSAENAGRSGGRGT